MPTLPDAPLVALCGRFCVRLGAALHGRLGTRLSAPSPSRFDVAPMHTAASPVAGGGASYAGCMQCPRREV
eukprot:scaffold306444_cov33-Tisochrysis_lutea.AAC.2